ncbi:hypothetical protein [Bacillus smithii]|nr:hypothetical protein [Bacillus smithii]
MENQSIFELAFKVVKSGIEKALKLFSATKKLSETQDFFQHPKSFYKFI